MDSVSQIGDMAARLAAMQAPLSQVQLLVLDFDGVLTDNRVLVNQDGLESVWCHRGDGWGIARLLEAGVPVMVLSTETNPVVTARCQKLGIPAVQGSRDKASALQEIAGSRNVDRAGVAFVGNDVNDLGCLGWAKIAIAVADAVPEVRAIADLITTTPGGYGAVREVADWILAARRGAG